jgi:hypothetical protein
MAAAAGIVTGCALLATGSWRFREIMHLSALPGMAALRRRTAGKQPARGAARRVPAGADPPVSAAGPGKSRPVAADRADHGRGRE